MVRLHFTFMDESYSLLIGLNYSSDCDRWSVVAESHSDTEIRHGQEDNLTIPEIWPNTGGFRNDKVGDEEIELYHQICVGRGAVGFLPQRVTATYVIRPVMQRLLETLFPNQKTYLRVRLNLPERSMCSKLFLIES